MRSLLEAKTAGAGPDLEEGNSAEDEDTVMSKQEQIMRAWVRFPERWQQLWDACEQGEGRYTRGVFVLTGKSTKPMRRKTQQQIIVELLKGEPMGYLS